MSKFLQGRRWCLLLAAAVVAGWFFAGRPERSVTEPRPGGRTQVAELPGPKSAPSEAVTDPAFRAGAFAGRDLFAFAQPANAAALDAALPAPTRAIHYVRLNRALLAGKASPFWLPAGVGRFEVPLPASGSLSVVIDRSEMLDADRFTSTGHLDGRPESRAIFAYNEGFLHASIEDPVLGKFALRTATAEFSQFYRIDPALLAPCGGGRRPVIDAQVLAEAAARRARQAAIAGGGAPPAPPGTAAAENPQPAEIHLMIAYTPALLGTLAGSARTAALQSAFDAAVAKVNAAFAASLITARVKLVQMAETTYAADGPVDPSNRFVRDLQNNALTALQGTADRQMDELHALRDAVGADVVCLVLNRQDNASIGLSYVLESPSISADPAAASIANYNALFAFSVIEYAAMTGGNVLPHELGHVLGCSHDRAHTNSAGAFPYSYGYSFFGADGRQYRDIMAYPPGTELSYFSTPRVVLPPPINAPIGIAAGQPGEADAARTIEQNAFEVSSFRLQTQAAANPGTLINVSTRAFVGTGDQVLIGGFVVSGAQAKKVLVRAAGPALIQYGVPNVLADPVLRIFSGQTQMAANDDWNLQEPGTSAAEVAAAGGFAFAAGSRDAALLLTLPSGAYTAIVEGKAGASGSGLVEVYDADSGGAKLINLSTRGYADRNGKEMFGGFVVRAGPVPGATKRVLVRVLGPTLSRAPFGMSGTMEDPFLALHNAAGELLIQNDDWSTGAEGGISAQNDFKPTVRYYSEKQIAATGFAPTNRREPCVMVDLPPGAYTVIASPFELIDPNPTIAQPARPGVGIVEVYEIDP